MVRSKSGQNKGSRLEDELESKLVVKPEYLARLENIREGKFIKGDDFGKRYGLEPESRPEYKVKLKKIMRGKFLTREQMEKEVG